MHADIVKLRAMDAQAARAEDACLGPDPSLAITDGIDAKQKKKRARKYKSRAKSQNHHCSKCGRRDHKRPRCPLDDGLEEEERASRQRTIARMNNKRRMALVAHLKYVSVVQRDESFEMLPKRRRLQKVTRSLREEERMGPLEFQALHVESGLFDDLHKAPCPITDCRQRGVLQREPFLSKYSVVQSVRKLGAVDCTTKNGCYRCQRCRRRFSATFRNPLFVWDTNLHVGVSARRYCVEGVPQTTAVLLLKADARIVQQAYDSARDVMHFDALRRQKKLVFGGRGSITTDIEADCSAFLKWKEVHGDEVWYYYWVVLGVMERGRPHTLWLKVLGARYAVGEPRVNPEGDEDWHPVVEELFTETSNCILHADGAPVYKNTHKLSSGIVEVHQVNHQAKEYARSCVCIADVSKKPGEPGHTRPGMAGTMSIDSEWRRVKKEFPENKLGGRTADGQRRASKYLRCGQWKRMTAREDRWQAFCQAAQDYRKAASDRDTLVKPRLSKAARRLLVKAPLPVKDRDDECELVQEPAAKPDRHIELMSAPDAQRLLEIYGSGCDADAAQEFVFGIKYIESVSLTPYLSESLMVSKKKRKKKHT